MTTTMFTHSAKIAGTAVYHRTLMMLIGRRSQATTSQDAGHPKDRNFWPLFIRLPRKAFSETHCRLKLIVSKRAVTDQTISLSPRTQNLCQSARDERSKPFILS